MSSRSGSVARSARAVAFRSAELGQRRGARGASTPPAVYLLAIQAVETAETFLILVAGQLEGCRTPEMEGKDRAWDGPVSDPGSVG